MSWQRMMKENIWRETKENIITSLQKIKIESGHPLTHESIKETDLKEFWDNLSLIEKQSILCLDRASIIDGFVNSLINCLSCQTVFKYI